MTTVPSADAKAVVRALEALSTQVRRIADALSTPVVEVAEAQPTTDDDALRAFREARAEIDADAIARVTALAERWKYTSDRKHGPREELLRALHTYPVATGPRSLAEAPAADEAARRTTRVASIRNLLDRAGRGVLIGGTEGELLRQQVEAELRLSDQLRAGRETWKAKSEEIERDRDRLAAELEQLRTVLAYEHKRANDAIDRETTAEQAAEEQRRRADIFETELRVLRTGLRANGADPTQIQNLWAQIRLRNRQWREAKGERDQAQAAIERVRQAVAHDHDEDCRYTIGCDVVLAALDGAERQPTDPEGLRAKVDEATATLRRVRSALGSLKDRGATGQEYHKVITDALAGPRPDDD